MADREKVILQCKQAIDSGESVTDYSFYYDVLSLLKEQEVVHCKDCIYRGKSEKCILAVISEEKDCPLFMLDNRGEWFCADGKRKEGQ